MQRPEPLGFHPGSSLMGVRRGKEAHFWRLLLLFVHMLSSISCNINSCPHINSCPYILCIPPLVLFARRHYISVTALKVIKTLESGGFSK